MKINNISRFMYRRRIFFKKNKSIEEIEADKNQEDELKKVLTRKKIKI